MNPPTGLRLSPGGAAPTQQSQVSCGSACLVVARMMRDPMLSRWVRTGIGDAGGPAAGTPRSRFAELERRVMARTNAVSPHPGLVQVPWPKKLGTPPWGALVELERHAAVPGTGYQTRWLRAQGRAALSDAYGLLASRVGPGRPALLYVGNSRLPRHVVLVFVGAAEQDPWRLLVYEPARGQVRPLDPVAWSRRRLELAGWNHPWLVIQPVGQHAVTVRHRQRRRELQPRPVLPGGALIRGIPGYPGQPAGPEPTDSARTTSRTWSTCSSR